MSKIIRVVLALIALGYIARNEWRLRDYEHVRLDAIFAFHGKDYNGGGH